MVTRWKSGKPSGRLGSGVQGTEGAQSMLTGICSDNDCERFSLKFFFLVTQRKSKYYPPHIRLKSTAKYGNYFHLFAWRFLV